jgi:hypothetical protein
VITKYDLATKEELQKTHEDITASIETPTLLISEKDQVVNAS